MIAAEKVAIVDPTPGVTRDRVSIVANLESPDGTGPIKPVEFTDTGGFGVYVAEGARFNEIGEDLSTLTDDIEFQIGEAVSASDLILFAVDCQAGLTAQDLEIARMLREQRLGKRTREGGKLVPVRVVATKCDGPRWEPHAFELSSLGFDEPLICSAKSNYFRRDMLDTLWELMPVPTGDPEPVVDLRMAIIGKRNTGKSTLVNTLAGQKRVIVSEIAGTTRDSVDVRFEMGGKSMLAIDTAGLRKKKSFQDQIEWYAFDRAKRSIMRADVLLLMVDATEPMSQVDEQLAMLAQKSFKPVVIVVNKWDLVDGRASDKGKPITVQDYEKYLRKELKGLSFAPIAFMSAQEGLNIRQTVDLAFEMYEQSSERVSTGKLNRIVEQIFEARAPSSKQGRHANILFAVQIATNPPTIVLVVNFADLFTHNYQRYLMNRFRETLPFAEVPIKMIIRGRKPGKKGETIDLEAEREGLLNEEEMELEELANLDTADFFEDD